jgi:hypothetical protein
MVNCLIDNYEEILEANGWEVYFDDGGSFVIPKGKLTFEMICELVEHCDKARATRKLTGEKITW